MENTEALEKYAMLSAIADTISDQRMKEALSSRLHLFPGDRIVRLNGGEEFGTDALMDSLLNDSATDFDKRAAKLLIASWVVEERNG